MTSSRPSARGAALALLAALAGLRRTPARGHRAAPSRMRDRAAGPSVARPRSFRRRARAVVGEGSSGSAARTATMSDLGARGRALQRDGDVRGGPRPDRHGAHRARARDRGGRARSPRCGRSCPSGVTPTTSRTARMYLAARGCRRIWVAPASSVDAIGIAAQTDLLSQAARRGARAQRRFSPGRQVQGSRGAVHARRAEPRGPRVRSSRRSPTCASAWLDGLAKGRPAAAPGAAEDGPYSAAAAKDRRPRRRGRLLRRGARRAGEGDRRAARRGPPRAGCARTERAAGSAGDLARSRATRSPRRRSRGLVRATGAISMEGEGPASESGGIVERPPRARDPRPAGARRRREGGRAPDRLARRKRARERPALARAHAAPRQEAARRQHRRHGGERRVLPRVHRQR